MIRKAEGIDTDQLLRIWLSGSIQAHSFLPPDFWASKLVEMRDDLLPISESYVFERESEVFGFVSIIGTTVAGLYVDPAMQQHGVGKQLLNHAKYLRDELLLTVFSKNDHAVNFYLRNGFNTLEVKIDPITQLQIALMKWKK